MIVRTFEGTNISELMKKIKLEIGKDATILSQKEKKVQGFKTKSYEIKVAIPESKDLPSHASKGYPSLKNELNQDSSDSKIDDIWRSVQNLQSSPNTKRIERIEQQILDLKRIVSDGLYRNQTLFFSRNFFS